MLEQQMRSEGTEASVIRARVDGAVGIICLNRPERLNALTTQMVRGITSALEEWACLGLRAVVFESASEQVFSAGGDIRFVRDSVLTGHEADGLDFFAHEYRMNALIASYPSPTIALVDGVCMGGGLGIAGHCDFLLASERASFAMPETAIGFFPDTGASFFLPRLAGAVGTYLGLTGVRIGASDGLACGLASHVYAHGCAQELARMINTAPSTALEDLLHQFGGGASTSAPTGVVVTERAAIDEIFAVPDLEQMTRLLELRTTSWARNTTAMLAQRSPQSVRLTHSLLLRGANAPLEECLATELAAAAMTIRTHDFAEGVRAVLVDKDNRPAWAAEQEIDITALLSASHPPLVHA